MRLDRKSLTVTLLCLTGAGTGSLLLYQDIADSGTAGRGPAMARVLHAENRVKRKSASSYVWNTVLQDQKLFRRESVQTGAESNALVQLKDGTTVEIRENSLIMMDDSRDLAKNFIRGSLIVHGKTGDSVMTIGDNGKLSVEEIPVQLIQPSPAETRFVNRNASTPVRFEWKPRSGWSPKQGRATVQISQDPQFDSLHPVEDGAANLSAGHWFWRVNDGKEAVSAVGRFVIVEAHPLTLVAPLSGERVKGYQDTATVEFRWVISQNPLADSYLSGDTDSVTHDLEVSPDPDFQRIIASQHVSARAQQVRINGLPLGPLHWRIRSHWGKLSIVSTTHLFHGEKTQRAPIELLAPRENATLPEGVTRLSWRSVRHGQGEQYSISIVPKADGSLAPIALETQATGTTLPSLPAGQYRWRVRSTSSEGVESESDWRDLNIIQGQLLKLSFPAPAQKIWYWKKPPAFQFQWEADPLVTQDPQHSYSLELASDAAFESVVARHPTRQNSVRSSDLPIPPGEIHWRVKIVDQHNSVLKESAIYSFSIGLHPTLDPPVSASPESGTLLNPLELESEPILSWAAVEGAAKYEVVVTRLGRNPAAEEPWVRQVVKQTSFRLKDITEGTYHWTVRPIDQIDRSGKPLPIRKFIIDAGEPLEAPKPLTREVQ